MIIKSKYLLVIMVLFLSCEGPLFEIPPEPDTTAPLVVITNPADQAVLSDSVLITVYASDNDEVKLVQLFINDSLVLDSAQAPYEFEWNTKEYAEDEYHNIRARAVDYAENDNQTNPIRVTVDNNDNIKPTGALLYPFSGQILNGSISIIAEADDNDSLKSVVYYINGDSVGVRTSAPFIYDWDTTLEFDDYYYVINVQINDASGNHITLGPISVYIDNDENIQVDTTPPTGTIIYPPAAAVVSGSITIEIDAFDNEKVDKVEIIIDGSFSVVDQSSPYEYVWNTTTYAEDMDHFIAATVTDSSGNTTNLMPVTVFVDNDINIINDTTPPSIVLTNPAANQTVSGDISVTASAFDNIEVDRVEFYHNNILFNSDNSHPYEVSWDTHQETEDSEHIWHAKAYDSSNLETQSQAIAVYVNNEDNILPTGFIAQPYAGQLVSGNVEILISAFDNIGVSSVDLYINGENIISLTNAPYSHLWNTDNTIEDSQNFISAKINDEQGNSFNVPPIAVTVNNDPTINDNIPPVISILSPVSGTTVGDSVEVQIYAQDNIGIDHVLLMIDGIEYTLNDSPYVYLWNTYSYPNNSTHLISAIAIDSSNNQTTAQSISVSVENYYLETINNLSVTQGVGEINLSWESPYNSEKFFIYRENEFITETLETSYVDQMVTPGTIYCYQISAVNSLNIEGPSSEPGCNKALIPPPENLNGIVIQDTITLSWSPDSDASQYNLYRDGGLIYTGAGLSFVDGELDYNTSYSYSASCIDGNGDEGPESSPISITTHSEVTAPTLSLNVDLLEFVLDWTSVQDADTYRVYIDNVFLIEVASNTYTHTGTVENENCFNVSAVNSFGTEGPLSNQECDTGS